MPDNTYANMSTHDLLVELEDGNVLNASARLDELRLREIKQGDSDDSTAHRGAIRPTRAPLVG